jgi:ubiquinone/menaquinone biosynthesis C-methylase UbiE
MNASQEFDVWAAEGRDRSMEDRHWHTAKHVLALMPVEPGDTVLDLGTGSGYALRALREIADIGRGYGLDASRDMARNAASYTDDDAIGFLQGEFGALPFASDSVDHVFSMEAFFFAPAPHETLAEVRRILRPGGTFYCGVNFFEESVHSHEWQDRIDLDMTLWSAAAYREAFREAGLFVAAQDTIPDRETEIPPPEAFPTDEWETREAMVERFREHGTLMTVGVAPS